MGLSKCICISGWGDRNAALYPLASLLKKDREVIATSPYSLYSTVSNVQHSSYCRNLIQMLNTNEGVYLVGWSMGGLIALEAAYYQAERIKGLVLISSFSVFCCPKTEVHELGVKTKTEVKAMIRGMKNNPKMFMKKFILDSYNGNMGEKTIEERLNYVISDDNSVLFDGLDYLLTADCRPYLNYISQPTLIIHGSDDRIVNVSSAEFLHRNLQKSKLIKIENGSHAICEQDTETVVINIREFFSQHEQSIN